MAFSKLKAHLCRIGARTFADLFSALVEICALYSQDECCNYFRVAGCVASQRRVALGNQPKGMLRVVEHLVGPPGFASARARQTALAGYGRIWFAGECALFYGLPNERTS